MLTGDIISTTTPCIEIVSDDVILDGDGYKLLGNGVGNGIVVNGSNNVVKHLFVLDFENGIMVQGGVGNNISVNYLAKNDVGISLSSTSGDTTVNNNQIDKNLVGIYAGSSNNKIYHNIIFNNKEQIQDVGGNTWALHNLGNFWGNYWGKDLNGDYVGDTLLPHEGVDNYPVTDPSELMNFGPFLAGDWWQYSTWLVWRGGWSPVDIQVTDPFGGTISADENTMGLGCFYLEEETADGTKLVHAVIGIDTLNPFEGTYSFQMEALDDLTYDMEWFASAYGERFSYSSVEQVPLAAGETRNVETIIIEEVVDPETGEIGVRVANNSPLVGAISPPLDPSQGTVATFSAVFWDPDIDDTHAAVWDWGDGIVEPGTVDEFAGVVSGSHVYADDNTYIVTVTVTDNESAFSSDSLAVTINNVAPVVDAGFDQTVDEGDIVGLDPASFNDLGTLDTHTATIDWGDGIVESGTVTESPFGPPGSTSGANGTVYGSHVYADDGTYTVTVTVTDDEGAVSADILTITVNNVYPTLAPLADQLLIVEGQFITVGPANFNDPGFDNPLNTGGQTEESFTATINWGDGTIEPAGDITIIETDGSPGTPTTGTIDAVHAYADNGAYNVTLTVFDDDGGSDSETFQVTVNNVAPTLTTVGDQTVNECALLNINIGTFTDPGFDNASLSTVESFTYSIDWGDGTTTDTGIPSCISGNEGVLTDGWFDGSHVYTDDGTYTVTVALIDDDGDSDTGTFQVMVDNIAPTVSVDTTEQTVHYSDSINEVIITATDVPTDIMNAVISDLPDAGTIPGGLEFVGSPQVGTGTWILRGIADLAPGTYVCVVTVYDEDGGSTDVDITLNVQQEDALVTYNGPEFVSTPSVRDNVAVVELRAIIQDVTAVYPGSDLESGDITCANVTFVIRTGSDDIIIEEDVTVDLLDSDPMTGIASCLWEVDLGTSDCEIFMVGIIVDGYYTRDSSADNTIITVSKPVENSVTGGGYLINESSGGIFAGDTDLKTNFGFNVKFNKKLTNLQGRVNIIIRQGDRVYQIKTNAMWSLVVDPETSNDAIFVSKANLMDITDPYNPISISGNLTLLISLTDSGNSVTADSIGITLWDGNDLWFSSNWTGTETLEQLLAGGNLTIHG
jgi:parallel beta-helix repeat protein